MACGIALAQYYAREMLRLHSASAVAPQPGTSRRRMTSISLQTWAPWSPPWRPVSSTVALPIVCPKTLADCGALMKSQLGRRSQLDIRSRESALNDTSEGSCSASRSSRIAILDFAKAQADGGLMEIRTDTPFLPRAYFTERGLDALRRLASNRRYMDQHKFAHVRRELGSPNLEGVTASSRSSFVSD